MRWIESRSTLQLDNRHRFQPAGLSYAEYERPLSTAYGIQDSLVSIEEATHFFPPRSMSPPQIEAPDVVLPHRREFNLSSVVLTIVAYYYPAP